MKVNFLMTAELCKIFNTKRDVEDVQQIKILLKGYSHRHAIDNRNWCVDLYSFTQNTKSKIQISKSGRCFSLIFCHILLVSHVRTKINGDTCLHFLCYI